MPAGPGGEAADRVGMYQARTYRGRVRGDGLTAFGVVVKETDLMIRAETDLTDIARESVLRQRRYLEDCIRRHPAFARSLVPWSAPGREAGIIEAMTDAGKRAGVGPMAAVAGAIAEAVGRDLLAESPQVVVENGGDIFCRKDGPATVALYAGASPLSLRVGIRLAARAEPICICTSSGSVGHSLSRGRADAVCVVSPSGALADALATALGNRIRYGNDIEAAIEAGRRVAGVSGIVAVAGRRIGAWGDLEVVPLDGKRG